MTRSEFTAPLAIQIYGETLANMNLEQYTAFVHHLGKGGLRVTVPSEPPSQLYFAEQDCRVDRRFLVDQDTACLLMKQRGVHANIYGRAWYFLEQRGYYYPNTPRGVFNSAQHLGERLLFYYSADKALDETTIFRGHGDGIDFENGLKAGTTIGPNLSYEFLADLGDLAKLDIQSLRAVLDNGSLRHQGATESATKAYEILCDEIEGTIDNRGDDL